MKKGCNLKYTINTFRHEGKLTQMRNRNWNIITHDTRIYGIFVCCNYRLIKSHCTPTLAGKFYFRRLHSLS